MAHLRQKCFLRAYEWGEKPKGALKPNAVWPCFPKSENWSEISGVGAGLLCHFSALVVSLHNLDKSGSGRHHGGMDAPEAQTNDPPRRKKGGPQPGSGRPPVDPRFRTVSKGITLTRHHWGRLAAQGKKGETPSQIIKRLIELSEAGAWD